MFQVRRILSSAVAAAVLTSVTVSNAAPSPTVSFPASLKIVAFGSSSTQGVGASGPAASYPSQLQIILRKALPASTALDVVNRGIGGEDADDMAGRLDKDVIARHPDLVIWQTGSNDPMRHVPLVRFEKETRDGIRTMQAAGIKVMLMEPQWCPHLAEIGTADSYRAIVRRIGDDMGITVIRRYDLMQNWVRTGLITKAEMISADNLHMRDKGYALLARWVASAVLRTEAATVSASRAAQSL